MKTIVEKKIQSMEVFKNLSSDTIKELASIAQINCYLKGEHIFRDKEKVNNIYTIISGKVALYKMGESAQKKIIFILGRDKIINAVVIDDLPASINCEVFENAEILCFEQSKFVEIMSKDFELTKIVLNSLSIKVRRLYRQLKNATPIKVEKRVAAKLWKLSKDYGVPIEDGVVIDLNISITYLADMFGTQRETISRALKILHEKNLIYYKNKQIIIKDSDALATFFKSTSRE